MKVDRKVRYTIYFVVVILLLIVPFREENYNIDMKKLDKSLSGNINKEYVVKGNNSDLRKFYHVSFDDMDEFILYIPATSMRVNEIAVFKTKKGKEDLIYKKVLERKQFQKKVFEGYGVEQCKLLDNSILKKAGQYIIYITGEDVKTLYKVLEEEAK